MPEQIFPISKEILFSVSNNEILYQYLLDSMNDAVLVRDENDTIIFANKKFYNCTEYAKEEIIGTRSYSFWDKESLTRIQYIHEHVRKKGISSQYEATIVTKQGKKIPMLISGSPLPKGGCIAVISDLSEFKKKESLYKMLIEHINEGVLVADNNEKAKYMNPKFCELIGYTSEELLGKNIFQFCTEESIARIKYVDKTLRAKGISSTYEIQLIAKSGEIIPVSINGTPLPEGESVGIIMDLRPLKEKEKIEQILNTATKFSTAAIIVFTQSGIIQSWNKGAKLIFGYKDSEIIGSHLDKIFNKKDIVDILKSSTVRYNFELQAKYKNKTPIKISMTITPIVSKWNKKEKFYLLIARDITHQSKYEEEIALKYQKIKEAYNQFGIIRRQMDYLFELIDLVSQFADKKSIADFIVSSIIMLTKVDACVLRFYNKKKKTLDLISVFGVAEDWQGKMSIKFENSLAQKAFLQHAPLRIIDVTKESRYQSRFLARKQNLCSLLLIPLEYRREFFGSLSLYSNPDKKLEIFENEFIEKYSRLIEIILGSILRCEI